ncbi:hypothetical protein BLNAU_7983 [Blattamonas nauphoetae]|uniref:RING-type E3 ubiquitin transferase n=1 Tax=Blattamonas nauphoetae TaxID=2049346 RepID=A0ABQ9Y078_9EUKA|nr:hypothetical protein BLNAU_7983 [Blattamonas nauphoetae]
MISTFSKIDSPPTQDHLSFCSQLIDCLRVPPEEQQSQLALDKYKLLSIGLGKSPKQALLQLKSDSLPYEFSCSNVLMHGDKAYRCNDCCRGNPLIYHNILQTQVLLTVNGGTCDCGRDNAWDPAGMCTKHQQNRAIGDPLTSIRQESTKQKLQDFTHALCDTVTSLIITQYFQLSKLWDGFRLEVALGKSLEKTVASGQDKVFFYFVSITAANSDFSHRMDFERAQ